MGRAEEINIEELFKKIKRRLDINHLKGGKTESFYRVYCK